MLKYSIKLIAFTFFLSMISYPICSAYPFIMANGSELAANQLAIDVHANTSNSDKMTIVVTAGSGTPIEYAEVSIDSKVIGTSNSNGKLEYEPDDIGMHTITATKLGYEKAVDTVVISDYVRIRLKIECPSNESSINRNVVIVIDASGSTGGGDPVTGLTFIGQIDANAINIVRSISRDSRAGVVAFGGTTEKTDMLSMGSEVNKGDLENFIKEIGPKGGDNPTNLDDGLTAAEDLLNSVSGEKEIIVISDGLISSENFDQMKNKVINLKNKSIKIQFVQVLLAYSYKPVEEANRLYNELAKFSIDGHAIVLNPDERANIFLETLPSEKSFSEEPCSTRINETLKVTVASSSGRPIEGAEVSFDDIGIGTTNGTGMINSYTLTNIGLYNLTATKLGYEKAVKMIQVLPAPAIASNQTATINKTLDQELSNTSNKSKKAPAEIKETPGFEGMVALLTLFTVIMFRRIF